MPCFEWFHVNQKLARMNNTRLYSSKMERNGIENLYKFPEPIHFFFCFFSLIDGLGWRCLLLFTCHMRWFVSAFVGRISFFLFKGGAMACCGGVAVSGNERSSDGFKIQCWNAHSWKTSNAKKSMVTKVIAKEKQRERDRESENQGKNQYLWWKEFFDSF